MKPERRIPWNDVDNIPVYSGQLWGAIDVIRKFPQPLRLFENVGDAKAHIKQMFGLSDDVDVAFILDRAISEKIAYPMGVACGQDAHEDIGFHLAVPVIVFSDDALQEWFFEKFGASPPKFDSDGKCASLT